MSRLAGLKEKKQREVLLEVARQLPEVSLNSCPPKIAFIVNKTIQRFTNNKDVYLKIKEKSNKLALGIYDRLKRKVNFSHDRLLMAVELAIAGNLIDYGVKNTLNIEVELEKILKEENKSIKQESKVIFDYKKFKTALKKAKIILYLADNAGETVFDRILIEEIKKYDGDKKVIYATRGKPIINDALIEDAYICGIDEIANVISSGVDTPGIILSRSSKEFLKIYRKADMVISKGQGNFEALSYAKRSIFFLFMAKCPVVAKEVGAKLGDIVLFCNQKKNR